MHKLLACNLITQITLKPMYSFEEEKKSLTGFAFCEFLKAFELFLSNSNHEYFEKFAKKLKNSGMPPGI